MPAQRPSTTTMSTSSTRVPQLDVAEPDLASHLLIGAEEQLLAGLAADVERAADLGAAEAAVVEQSAVLAGERHALGDRLVDDVHRQLGEPVDVALTGAEVAALDRVVEQPVDAVAVAAVVLRRVDAALGGDRVGAARRVVEGERLDLVAELGERRRGRRAGEAGADDEDLELALVVRVDQLRVGDVADPTCRRGAHPGPCRRARRLGSTFRPRFGDGHSRPPQSAFPGHAGRCCAARSHGAHSLASKVASPLLNRRCRPARRRGTTRCRRRSPWRCRRRRRGATG